MFLLIDTIIFIQTIKARNYVETKATYADKKDDVDSEFFVDYIYVFVDKEGRRHKIVERFFKENSIEPKLEILVKYNVNNPQDNYTEESLLDKSEMIWYIVKIGIFILLIILFSNKKILNKINI